MRGLNLNISNRYHALQNTILLSPSERRVHTQTCCWTRGTAGGNLGESREKFPPDAWGSIDIINELRELNYPEIEVGSDGYYGREHLVDDFDECMIHLREDNPPRVVLPEWVDHIHYKRVMIETRNRFVNNFLEDAILKDKILTWGKSGVSSVTGSWALGVLVYGCPISQDP